MQKLMKQQNEDLRNVPLTVPISGSDLLPSEGRPAAPECQNKMSPEMLSPEETLRLVRQVVRSFTRLDDMVELLQVAADDDEQKAEAFVLRGGPSNITGHMSKSTSRET